MSELVFAPIISLDWDGHSLIIVWSENFGNSGFSCKLKINGVWENFTGTPPRNCDFVVFNPYIYQDYTLERIYFGVDGYFYDSGDINFQFTYEKPTYPAKPINPSPASNIEDVSKNINQLSWEMPSGE